MRSTLCTAPDLPGRAPTRRLDGVVIGVLLGITPDGAPLVAFPGNPRDTAVPARATARLEETDLGREVALLFEDGDPARPLLIGVVRHPNESTATTRPVARIDDDRLVLSAQREIVLQCGKASITLTREGKILIKGAYVLSRSSGAQRIRGATVEIN